MAQVEFTVVTVIIIWETIYKVKKKYTMAKYWVNFGLLHRCIEWMLANVTFSQCWIFLELFIYTRTAHSVPENVIKNSYILQCGCTLFKIVFGKNDEHPLAVCNKQCNEQLRNT